MIYLLLDLAGHFHVNAFSYFCIVSEHIFLSVGWKPPAIHL